MRVLLVAMWLLVSARSADACPPPDVTYVVAPGGRLGDHAPAERPTKVPPNPNLYVHLGSSSPPGMPTFTRPDGSVVPSRIAEKIDLGWEELLRVELAIEAGEVLVKVPVAKPVATLPGAALVAWSADLIVWGYDELLVGTLEVTPAFAPSKVSVTRNDDVLELGGNASLYRLDSFAGTHEYSVWGATIPARGPFRVAAVYADGSEQVVYVRWATEPVLLGHVLWLFALACSAWIGARFARGFGH